MTTLEYSLLVVAIVMALLAGQNILRRVICGRWKAAGDSVGYGMQYEPGVTTVTVN